MTPNGIIWGGTRRSRYIHAYPSLHGKSFCGRSSGPDRREVTESWNKDDPETCPVCLWWVRRREKGLAEAP